MTAQTQPAQLQAALHDFRSLYNVGAVFRTASGAGLSHLYLSGYTGAPPQAGIAKVALGAEQEIPFSRPEDPDALLAALSGSLVVALEQHPGSIIYRDVPLDPARPTTILLGGELIGLPSELLARADHIAELPMAGEKESLNVASAFAVVAYDFAIRLGIIGEQQLRSRHPRPVRPGVLTNGPTIDERPFHQ